MKVGDLVRYRHCPPSTAPFYIVVEISPTQEWVRFDGVPFYGGDPYDATYSDWAYRGDYEVISESR